VEQRGVPGAQEIIERGEVIANMSCSTSVEVAPFGRCRRIAADRSALAGDTATLTPGVQTYLFVCRATGFRLDQVGNHL
jgi:hypothetical protein